MHAEQAHRQSSLSQRVVRVDAADAEGTTTARHGPVVEEPCCGGVEVVVRLRLSREGEPVGPVDPIAGHFRHRHQAGRVDLEHRPVVGQAGRENRVARPRPVAVEHMLAGQQQGIGPLPGAAAYPKAADPPEARGSGTFSKASQGRDLDAHLPPGRSLSDRSGP